MKKAIWFDMDGTLNKFYDVRGWLEMLTNEDVTPYLVAPAKVDTEKLAIVLNSLSEAGFEIGIISWRAKYESKEYAKAVREAKIEWLKKEIPFTFDKIHIVKYGTAKHTVPAKDFRNGILVDDNEEVRNKWEKYGGITINAEKENWLENLEKILDN